MKYYIALLTLFNFYFGVAQTEVFHDFSYEHRIHNYEEWLIYGELEWKHLYGEEGWSRTSYDIKIERELGVLTFVGGLKNNYIFDADIVNYWEIRPWLGFELSNDITHRLILNQELKGEFRNFFFNDDNYDFNFRTKFKVGLEYPLKYLEEDEKEDWIICTEIEWFFLRNEEINERYISSREYSLLMSKKICTDRVLTFGVRLEEYSNNLENENDKAITVVARLEI